MANLIGHIQRWIGWQALHQLILVLIVIAGTTTPAYAQSEPYHVHPALLTLAEENPNEIIRVIVQQNAPAAVSRQAVAEVGGAVANELTLINGLVLELPARSVMQLARARGINWITIDAPVVPAAANQGCNLLSNPGFENQFAGWNNSAGTGNRKLSGQAHSGAFAIYLDNQRDLFAQQIADAQAGVTYQASGIFRRVDTIAAHTSLQLEFLSAAGIVLDSTSADIAPSTTYQSVSTAATAPVGTMAVRISIKKAAGSMLYVDDLIVQKTDTAANGCSAQNFTTGHNLLSNGSFENDLQDWLYQREPRIVDDAYAGKKALYLGTSAGLFGQIVANAEVGQIYTAQAVARRAPGSAWSGLGVAFLDARGNYLHYVSTTIPETTKYAPVVATGTAPAGTTRVAVWAYQNQQGQLYLDEISLTAGTAPESNIRSIGADQLWHGPQPLDGTGVTVAVVDSGIAAHPDLQQDSRDRSRIAYTLDLTGSDASSDRYGHGTHVAGIIGGNGNQSQGRYRGVAPGVNLLDIRVSDGEGMTYSSDLITGLQWIYENKDAHNIRVVNISLNSTVPESYHNSPINAAVELLWFTGITVVVSAGNNGTGYGPVPLFAPANDPFVITVGAVDGRNTNQVDDDRVANFSAYGTTSDGIAKPDLVAPGQNIVSLSAGTKASLILKHPSHVVDHNYFRMSGTSMAAPTVSGAIALLLQAEPNLLPDQIKHRLQSTANQNWRGYSSERAGAGQLNIYAAVHNKTKAAANQQITISKMLSNGSLPVTWNNQSWSSVSWNSVSWNSVSWNSVSWNSVSWNSCVWQDEEISEFSTDTLPSDFNTTLPKLSSNATAPGEQDALPNKLYLPLINR